MKNKLPIVAVIPTYNAANTLPRLLDELIRQKYDKIFVIDDHSTDNTVEVVKSYEGKVQLIEGEENVGSGANRNRIIGHTDKAILHFIDADMQLLSRNTPQIIRSLKLANNTAYVGGLIRNPNGEQNPFNYGPRASLVTTLQSWVQYAIWFLGRYFRPLASILQTSLQPMLHNWPNIYRKPRPRQTFWAAESNMVIKAEMYERLGGYDPIFKYSEITDFSIRLHRLGLKTYFNPNIDALHDTIDNILYRSPEKHAAFLKHIQKHGYWAFVIPKVGDHLAGRKTQKRYHR